MPGREPSLITARHLVRFSPLPWLWGSALAYSGHTSPLPRSPLRWLNATLCGCSSEEKCAEQGDSLVFIKEGRLSGLINSDHSSHIIPLRRFIVIPTCTEIFSLRPFHYLISYLFSRLYSIFQLLISIIDCISSCFLYVSTTLEPSTFLQPRV